MPQSANQPALYNKIRTRTGGASIGTIMQVARPSTWTNSNNEGTEAGRWQIGSLYPGWIECDGRSLSKTDGRYKMLYDIIGNTYGSTGSTFNIPDYRGVKLMGTGKVDGNNGSSPYLFPNHGPDGTEGEGSFLLPGSVGGDYQATVTRFAPAGSEITEGAPTGARVQYYANEFNSFTSSISTSQVEIRTFGTGIGEIGGFADPNFAEVIPSNRYYSFARNNTISSGTTRTLTLNGVNTSNYDKMFVTAIAGNDTNGGERPNDSGERLKVTINGQGPYTIIPARGDSSLGGEDWDTAYAAWQTATIDIPPAAQGNSVQIVISSVTTFSAAGEFRAVTVGETTGQHDAYGVLKIGFLNTDEAAPNTFGGDATDTFSIGRYRTAGWDKVESFAEASFTGNISFTIGETSNEGTSVAFTYGVPPHRHYVLGTEASGLTFFGSPKGSPAPGTTFSGNARNAVFTNDPQPLIQYDRSGSAIRSHSHGLALGPVQGVARMGNDNYSGDRGGSHPNGYWNTTDDEANGGPFTVSLNGTNNSDLSQVQVGETATQTIDVLNEMGITPNVGSVVMTNRSRLPFDEALKVYLQSGEGINLIGNFTRTKYIIKAYVADNTTN